MKKILISFLVLLCFICLAQEAKKSGRWCNFFNRFSSAQENKNIASVKPKVAVISLGEDPDISQTLFQLTTAAKDKEISAILLTIDCGGGVFAEFSGLHDLIKKICIKKPIIGFVIGRACSGGYLVASATNYIITQSASDIGSIGVNWETHKYKEPKVTGNIDAKLEVELFTAGGYKAMTHPHKDFTEQERAYIKTYVEKLYELFLKNVAGNRNLDLNNYKAWAEGKVHLASDALKMGLIDEIGTIFEAEKKIVELLSAKNPDIRYDCEIEYIY